MPDIRDLQFKNPLAKVNVETGEGFCRIIEFWQDERNFLGVWARYCASVAEKCRSLPAVAGESAAKEKTNAGERKRGRPRGRAKALRDLSDILSSSRRTG